MEGFTAATYNIHHGEGLDGVIDLSRVASVLRESGADVIALQELDRSLARTGGEDHVSRLEGLSGYTITFHATLQRGHGEYGIAIATRDGLENVRFEPLPRVASEEPRGAIVARWHGVTVISTHLSQHRRPRALQRDRVLDLALTVPQPVLVMGDLNQGPRALGSFRRAGLHGGGDHTRTFPAGLVRRVPMLLRVRPGLLGRKIDHILAGPGLEVLRAWTIPSPASDHLPVVAELARRP
ncbi:MAG: endonuclease/exonuclease/phosphatase family protein [Actinomycetota bacterium]|nr:endonuclease/exonuclease/phosphatase family protein [Actinomycetota bacterium]